MSRHVLFAFASFLALVPCHAKAAFKLIAPETQTSDGQTSANGLLPTPSPTPVIAQPLTAPSSSVGGSPMMAKPVAMSLPAGSLLDAARGGQSQSIAIPAPQMSVNPTTPDGADNIMVQGFGKSVPLHAALSQIAPSGREFGYGAGVNPAQTISWQGGQPWRDVLTASLKSQGLSFRETGSIIYVQKNSQSAPQAMVQPASMTVSVKPAMPKANASEKSNGSNTGFTRPMMVAMQEDADNETVADDMQHVQSVTTAEAPGDDMATVTSTSSVSTTSSDVNSAPKPLPAPVKPASMAGHISKPALMPSSDNNPMSKVTGLQSSWDAKPGSTLHSVLQQWCNKVDAELTWDAEYDYPIQAPLHIEGTFDDAVRSMLLGFAKANPPPKGQIFTGQGKQAILVITAPGNDYTN